MTEVATPKGQPSPAKKLLRQLQEEFKVIGDHLPLAIGIDKQLLESRPAIDRKLLRAALGMHTHSVRYLKSIQSMDQRFDLNGIAVGEVKEEHRSVASKDLIDRFKKRAQEHKAAQAVKDEMEKNARMERERLEKLDQLMSKFSRK